MNTDTGERGARPESLRKWLAWLYPDPEKPCRCESAYRSLGRLQGIDMGKGWVRITTHPDCPHHGTTAVKEARAAQRARLREKPRR